MNEIRELKLLDHTDSPWIEEVLDVVARSLGEPWRVLLARLEHAEVGASPVRVAAILRALRRVTGGRAERGRVARELRREILGQPALDAATRTTRLTTTAARIGISPADIEPMLWADLARERPVTLPNGRPDAPTLAAFANLDRIQSAVRRAYSVHIRVQDDANDLVRAAARFGLVASVTRAPDDATKLDITGPLSLFGSTTVYGRSLTALVPLLADFPRFTLDITCDRGGRHTLRVGPPLLLPAAPLPKPRRLGLAERLARDLFDLGIAVEREPPPIALAHAADLLFPELALEHRSLRWYVEIVGFATAEYLTHKLALYRDAGISRIALCIDAAHAVLPPPPLPCGRLLPFSRRIPPVALLSALDEEEEASS